MRYLIDNLNIESDVCSMRSYKVDIRKDDIVQILPRLNIVYINHFLINTYVLKKSVSDP